MTQMNDCTKRFRPDAISASEWRQIVQSAIDTAIITTDPEGHVTSWNEGAHRVLGWTEEEMWGQSLDHLFTEEDRRLDQLGREMRDALALGGRSGPRRLAHTQER